MLKKPEGCGGCRQRQAGVCRWPLKMHAKAGKTHHNIPMSA